MSFGFYRDQYVENPDWQRYLIIYSSKWNQKMSLLSCKCQCTNAKIRLNILFENVSAF